MGGPKDSKSLAAETTARRPYRAPQLRQLGSVRELTLGATMGAIDLSGGKDDKGGGGGKG